MPDNDTYTTAIVNKDFKGLRIDKFLSLSFPEISRSQIQRMLSLGNVVCDDVTIVDHSYKVKEGESFVLTVPESVDAEPKPQDIPIEIVYEDEDVVVVNKKAGMVVHPAAGAPDGTLVNALLFHCKDLSGIGGVKRPGIVHRIDKETSGLLVVAKNDRAHQFLCEQFSEHSINRTYVAFCYGVLQPLKGTIEGNIARSPYDRKKMAVVSKGGKQAVTHYETVKIFKTFASMINCQLETGRTHQIRVHLSKEGHGLIGDKVYGHAKRVLIKGVDEGAKVFIETFPRQALHAKSLGFIHPKTGQRLFFEADMPEDMQRLYQALELI